jgi:hypothetical protein
MFSKTIVRHGYILAWECANGGGNRTLAKKREYYSHGEEVEMQLAQGAEDGGGVAVRAERTMLET